MKGKYRDADSNQEIESILSEQVTEGCLIWQNIGGERVIYKIKNIEKSEDGKEIKFQILKYLDDFDLSGPIYVKLSYRGTMFRSEITDVRAGVLHLKFPLAADVKTIEMRGEPRISFDLNEDRFATLGVMHDGQWHKEQTLKFQVVDISESGICLLVSDVNKNYLKNSLTLAMIKLGAVELHLPILLTQCYSIPFRYRRKGKSVYAIRVGFKFESKISTKLINEFIKEL